MNLTGTGMKVIKNMTMQPHPIIFSATESSHVFSIGGWAIIKNESAMMIHKIQPCQKKERITSPVKAVHPK